MNRVQRAGHGDIVDTPDGKTYLVHLMGRPTTQKRRCVLGRETGIQEAEWRDDGWLWVKNGPVPSYEVDLPAARNDDATGERNSTRSTSRTCRSTSSG